MAYTARILAKDIVAATPEDTVSAAARAMVEAKVGSVAILGPDKRLRGIFTERDLLCRVVGKGLDPGKTRLSEVMTPNPATLQAEDSLDKVFSALSQGSYRHLPILDGNEVIGMASLHDFASLMPCLSENETAIERLAECALRSPREVIRVRKA